MSLIEKKVKEVMQCGIKNLAKDHSVERKNIQILISLNHDDLEVPKYEYALDWQPQREVNMTNDLLRPTFGLDLMMREEIAKKFIPKKINQISRDYSIDDVKNIKVVVMTLDEDCEDLLLVPYNGNKQITKNDVPVTLPFDYIVEF